MQPLIFQVEEIRILPPLLILFCRFILYSEAEGTEVYFGKDTITLFVNIQHPDTKDGDSTEAICKK